LGIYGSLFQRLPDVEFVIFEPRDCEVSKWFAGQGNLVSRNTPIPSMGSRMSKFVAGLGYWRQAFSKESFDLFEALHLPMVRPDSHKAILTIHDIRGLLQENGLTHRVLFASILRKALSKADHVVTVSEAMKEEILAFYPNTPVSVVYNGLNASVFDSFTHLDSELFLRKYGLAGGFLLAVGHLEPRKNYQRLIEVMAILKQRGHDYPLVIIGNNSGEFTTLSRQIASLNLESRVTILTGLSDLEVRCAYSLSSLLVFPSLYEGFGIPILEAMAAKCPMVLSDLPVFREITGDQSIYFHAEDLEAMADAIIVGSSSSEVREKMIRYGLTRLPDFGFDRLASQIELAYKTLL
jgi:glycosyltransferase involved in cell wall biosynthesis